MSESQPFKDYFNADLVRRLAGPISVAWGDFDESSFTRQASRGLKALELKERSRHIAAQLKSHLPPKYPQAIKVLIDSLGPPLEDKSESINGGFFYWPYADFVELYGLEYPEESMRANYEITRRFTAEFSIRPYIEQHYDYVMGLLTRWVDDPDHHVRRLVSEGTRPRLPWGGQLKCFINDPRPCIPFLDALCDDPSEYVRRSVANHINDIGKDNPETALDICRRWAKGATKETQWVIRHALRTHIKNGDPYALELLGYAPPKVVSGLEVHPKSIATGDAVELRMQINSTSSGSQALMVDYRIHFVRKNGKVGIKVFKWRDLKLDGGDTLRFSKKHSFRPITTRVYYPGVHKVDLQINGQVVAETSFLLTAGS